MRPRPARSAALLAIVVAIAVSSLSAAGQEAGMILDGKPVFLGPQRAPVSFPHEAHWGIEGVDCLACHHEFKDGKNTLDLAKLMEGGDAIRCASCHTRPAGLRNVSHLLCIGCHDGQGRQRKPSGPRSCGECHQRQGKG